MTSIGHLPVCPDRGWVWLQGLNLHSSLPEERQEDMTGHVFSMIFALDKTTSDVLRLDTKMLKVMQTNLI